MECRKLLGLGALLGLAPFLPKIDIGEEKPIPVERIGHRFHPEEFKNNFVSDEIEQDFIKINVTGAISITPKKRKSIIEGTGNIGEDFVSWGFEVKINHLPNDPLPIIKVQSETSGLWYNLMKVIYVDAEQQPKIPELYIEGVEEPFVPHPNFLNFEMKYIITCQKI